MMKTNEINHLLRAAVVDFKRNKARTILTALGIMIGVLSVVLLIALGLGLKNYLKEQFENLGANMIVIMPGGGFGGEGGGKEMSKAFKIFCIVVFSIQILCALIIIGLIYWLLFISGMVF